MIDPLKSNLEPIEERDLDLESKFTGAHHEVEKKEELFSPEKEENNETVSAEKDQSYSDVLSKIQKHSTNDDHAVVSDAQVVAQGVDAETQVNHLVEIAMQKGVAHAVKVAKHIDDYFVLDMLHDRLLGDELRNALIQKGLIKEL